MSDGISRAEAIKAVHSVLTGIVAQEIEVKIRALPYVRSSGIAKVREAALRDAAKDVCMYCRKRGSGFNEAVIRNDVGNYIHQSHETFTALGPQEALCKATGIHARMMFEAARTADPKGEKDDE